MATLWITYAWDDNDSGDVNFIAQELEAAGITVNLDRWKIGAGKRLWEQIDKFITDKNECDAWMIVATQNSITSEPCKEELSYALGRALESRGGNFPVLGLFQGPVGELPVPSALKTRLCVSVTDDDWKERIVAACEGRTPNALRPEIPPYEVKIHEPAGGMLRYAIEFRPRAGVWYPVFVATPKSEKKKIKPSVMIGPRNHPPEQGVLMGVGTGTFQPNEDNRAYDATVIQMQVSPTQSIFIWCALLPSRVCFGDSNSVTKYYMDFL
jgi:TIR domain